MESLLTTYGLVVTLVVWCVWLLLSLPLQAFIQLVAECNITAFKSLVLKMGL